MPSKPSGFVRRSLRRKPKLPRSRRAFIWETSSQRCLLKSPSNFFGACFKGGNNLCLRGSVEYVLPTQLPTNNQTYLFSPTDLKNGSNFLWPKMAHIPPTPKPIFWIYHQAYCNSFVRSIQRGLPLLPSRGRIATIPPSVGCLSRHSYVPTGTVNSTEVRSEDSKFDPHMFLLQTNWEINSTELDSNSTNSWFPSIHFFCPLMLYICLTNKYFELDEIFVIVSFVMQLELFRALLDKEVL